MEIKKIKYRKGFFNIRKRYLVVILVILSVFVARQMVVDYQISKNKDMSSVINIAGRQRMLCEKIAKDVLLLQAADSKAKVIEYRGELIDDINIWRQTQIDLQKGNESIGLLGNNSIEVKNLFALADPSHQKIIAAANEVLSVVEDGIFKKSELREKAQVILEREGEFLEQMDHIVFQYDKESQDMLFKLEVIEISVFIVILLLGFMVTVLVVLPGERVLQSTFRDLKISNHNFSTLFQTAHGALLIVNQETMEIVSLNDDAEKYVSVGKDGEIERDFLQELNIISDNKEELITRLKSTEKIKDFEVQISTRSNNRAICLISAVKGEYEGEVLMLVSINDISLQKKEEEAMKNLALKDELTGSYNRHFLEGIITEEFSRAERYKVPLSMLILDLDHFKNVNDTWGHPVGDTVLQQTAKIASEYIRSSDYLIRIGGEEFIVFMPHTNSVGASVVAEKIRGAIEASKHHIVGKYTASFGVAERRQGESYRELYKRVDEALYEAKQTGRNRVVCSDNGEEKKAPLVLSWKSEWNSGETAIDKQHRMLFDMANALLNMPFNEDTNDTMLLGLNQLLAHVVEHFEYEEIVLNKVNYPGYYKHTVIHKGLMEKGTKLQEDCEKGKVSLSAVYAFVVEDIIIGHLLQEDIKFFPYINGEVVAKDKEVEEEM